MWRLNSKGFRNDLIIKIKETIVNRTIKVYHKEIHLQSRIICIIYQSFWKIIRVLKAIRYDSVASLQCFENYILSIANDIFSSLRKLQINLLYMIENIYIRCLIIIIIVWTITHCLWLGHETMVSAVCLSIFSYRSTLVCSILHYIFKVGWLFSGLPLAYLFIRNMNKLQYSSRFVVNVTWIENIVVIYVVINGQKHNVEAPVICTD